jgi:hypothetical protein
LDEAINLHEQSFEILHMPLYWLVIDQVWVLLRFTYSLTKLSPLMVCFLEYIFFNFTDDVYIMRRFFGGGSLDRTTLKISEASRICKCPHTCMSLFPLL